MIAVPQLYVDAPPGSDQLSGFRFLWLKYVSGFKGEQTCARSLVGPYSKKVDTRMTACGPVTLDEVAPGDYDYLYLCGVTSPYRHELNLHLAVKPDAGDDDSAPFAEVETHNGWKFVIAGAVQVAILDLPPQVGAKVTAHQRACRNFQFGWRQYDHGLPV